MRLDMGSRARRTGRKGNKEKGIKARVELRERPPTVRCTRGIKLRGRDAVEHSTSWH